MYNNNDNTDDNNANNNNNSNSSEVNKTLLRGDRRAHLVGSRFRAKLPY